MIKSKLVKNVVLGLFVCYFAKLLTSGVLFQDSLVVGVLASLLGFLEYRDGRSVIAQISLQSQELQKSLDSNKKEIEELRSTLSTVKLAQQVRNVNKL